MDARKSKFAAKVEFPHELVYNVVKALGEPHKQLRSKWTDMTAFMYIVSGGKLRQFSLKAKKAGVMMDDIQFRRY